MLKTDDGTYYTFPFIRGDEILCVNQGIVIRGDWLDELGLSMPETIDEWHEVLTQFKEKKGAAAPLVYSGKNMLTNGGFIGAFGIKQDFFVEDGKVLFGPADARYQDFLATFAQWYDEGLLDENIANIDWKGMTANVINGKSGAAFGFAGSGMGQWNTSLREKDPDAHVVAAPFVAEKKNEKPKFGNLDWPYVGTGAAITTSCKNVELAAQICKHPLEAEAVLREVGLGERLSNFPAQLSGGEQQRVAIARALAKNPKLLLCDEPTGALDYQTGKNILSLLHNTCRNMQMTVIVITHNQAITQMADRVISVKNGQVKDMRLNEHPLDPALIEW